MNTHFIKLTQHQTHNSSTHRLAAQKHVSYTKDNSDSAFVMRALVSFLFLATQSCDVTGSGCHSDRNEDDRPRVSCVNQGLMSLPVGVEPLTQVLVLSGNRFTALSWSDYAAFTLLHELDLSRNDITALEPPGPVLETLSVLRLSGNGLLGLGGGVFRGAPGLMEIYLDSNRLRSLDDASFSGLRRLEVINLAGNGLPVLPARLLERVSSLKLKTFDLENNSVSLMPDGFFSSKPELPYVYLTHNPWLCSCSVGYLHSFLMDQEHNVYTHEGPNTIVPGTESILCAGPPHLSRRPITELTEDDFCPPEPLWTNSETEWEHVTQVLDSTADTRHMTQPQMTSLYTDTPEPLNTARPITTQPISTVAMTTQPITAGPITTAAMTTQPITTVPMTTVPITTRPITTVAMTTQPITVEPITIVAVTTRPITTVAMTTRPMKTPPITAVPMTTRPITAVPIKTVPITTVPMTTVPMTTRPMTTVPMTTRPITAEVMSVGVLWTRGAGARVVGVRVLPWCWWLFSGFVLLCLLSALTCCFLFLWLVKNLLVLQRYASGRSYTSGVTSGGTSGVTLQAYRRTASTQRPESEDSVRFLPLEQIRDTRAVFRSVLYVSRAERQLLAEANGGAARQLLAEANGGAALEREAAVTYRKTLHRLISEEHTHHRWTEEEERWDQSTERRVARYKLILREDTGRNVEWLMGEWEMGERGVVYERPCSLIGQEDCIVP